MLKDLVSGKYQNIQGDDEETEKAWKFLFSKVIQKRLERNKKTIFSRREETGTTLNQIK